MKDKIIAFLHTVSFDEKIANDYYGGVNEYYQKDKKVFNDAHNNAVKILSNIKRISVKKFQNACKRTWMGRLEYNGNKLHYTAGQFYDLELPQAVEAVLKCYLFVE